MAPSGGVWGWNRQPGLTFEDGLFSMTLFQHQEGGAVLWATVAFLVKTWYPGLRPLAIPAPGCCLREE